MVVSMIANDVSAFERPKPPVRQCSSKSLNNRPLSMISEEYTRSLGNAAGVQEKKISEVTDTVSFTTMDDNKALLNSVPEKNFIDNATVSGALSLNAAGSDSGVMVGGPEDEEILDDNVMNVTDDEESWLYTSPQTSETLAEQTAPMSTSATQDGIMAWLRQDSTPGRPTTRRELANKLAYLANASISFPPTDQYHRLLQEHEDRNGNADRGVVTDARGNFHNYEIMQALKNRDSASPSSTIENDCPNTQWPVDDGFRTGGRTDRDFVQYRNVASQGSYTSRSAAGPRSRVDCHRKNLKPSTSDSPLSAQSRSRRPGSAAAAPGSYRDTGNIHSTHQPHYGRPSGPPPTDNPALSVSNRPASAASFGRETEIQKHIIQPGDLHRDFTDIQLLASMQEEDLRQCLANIHFATIGRRNKRHPKTSGSHDFKQSPNNRSTGMLNLSGRVNSDRIVPAANRNPATGLTRSVSAAHQYQHARPVAPQQHQYERRRTDSFNNCNSAPRRGYSSQGRPPGARTNPDQANVTLRAFANSQFQTALSNRCRRSGEVLNSKQSPAAAGRYPPSVSLQSPSSSGHAFPGLSHHRLHPSPRDAMDSPAVGSSTGDSRIVYGSPVNQKPGWALPGGGYRDGQGAAAAIPATSHGSCIQRTSSFSASLPPFSPSRQPKPKVPPKPAHLAARHSLEPRDSTPSHSSPKRPSTGGVTRSSSNCAINLYAAQQSRGVQQEKLLTANGHGNYVHSTPNPLNSPLVSTRRSSSEYHLGLQPTNTTKSPIGTQTETPNGGCGDADVGIPGSGTRTVASGVDRRSQKTGDPRASDKENGRPASSIGFRSRPATPSRLSQGSTPSGIPIPIVNRVRSSSRCTPGQSDRMAHVDWYEEY